MTSSEQVGAMSSHASVYKEHKTGCDNNQSQPDEQTQFGDRYNCYDCSLIGDASLTNTANNQALVEVKTSFTGTRT